MNVTLRQLKAFLAGTTSASFSEAAEKSFLTQPGYSLLIRQLEAELGLKLFDRTTRRVEITRSGDELRARIAPLIEELEAVLQDTRNAVARRRGQVTIGFMPSLTPLLLSKVTTRMAAIAPDVAIVAKEDLCGQLIQMVSDETVDFAVGVGLPGAKALSFTPLVEDPMLGIFHPDDAILDLRPLTWDALKAVPFITFGMSSVEHCVGEAFARIDAQVQPILDVKMVSTGINLVRERIGFTVLPQLAIDLVGLDGVVVEPIKPVATRKIGILAHARKSLAPAAALALEVMTEAVMGLGLKPAGKAA
jgi:DNA-binding transcriptional LysR family regulator